jgi:hypothetical protein
VKAKNEKDIGQRAIGYTVQLPGRGLFKRVDSGEVEEGGTRAAVGAIVL